MIFNDMTSQYFDWLRETVCGDGNPETFLSTSCLRFYFSKTLFHPVRWMRAVLRMGETCATDSLRKKVSHMQR